MRLPDRTGVKLGILWFLRMLKIPMTIPHRLLLGQSIGKGVRIGRGSSIIARQLRIGNGVVISSGARIAAETIEIEDGVLIGPDVNIRCRHLIMRKRSRIDGHTTIYGLVTPNSALDMGEEAWIYSHCHVNTDHTVKFGAGSAMGSYSLIFTHSSYLPVTHGYPVTFAPVTVGNDVWLPWHVFILPGATIGSGATVGAFSVVSGSIPENSLAAGVPARVIKGPDQFRRRYSDEAMRDLGLRITGEVVNYVTHSFRPSSLFFPDERHIRSEYPGCWIITSAQERVYIIYAPIFQSQDILSHVPAETVLYICIDEEHTILPVESSWIDLRNQRSFLHDEISPLLREVVSHFSSYGIRFGESRSKRMTPSPEHPPVV